MKNRKELTITKKGVAFIIAILSVIILATILPNIEIQSFLDGTVKIIILLGFSITVIYVAYILITEIIDNQIEGAILLMSVIFAILLYYGSKAMSLSIPELLLLGFEQTDIFSLNAFLSMIGTFSAGFLVSWYMIKKTKNNIISKRVILFIITLFMFIFLDTFLSATNQIENNLDFNKKLLPNLIFIIGIFSYIIFNFKPNPEN